MKHLGTIGGYISAFVCGFFIHDLCAVLMSAEVIHCVACVSIILVTVTGVVLGSEKAINTITQRKV